MEIIEIKYNIDWIYDIVSLWTQGSIYFISFYNYLILIQTDYKLVLISVSQIQM